MTTESYSKLVDTIDKQPLKQILFLLTKGLITKTDFIKQQSAQIIDFKNEVTDLKEMMLEQDKYSFKDTTINNKLRLLENVIW